MNFKISQLRTRMQAFGLDGVIINNPINIRYLTGLQAEGYLLINENENVFVTDSRYIEEVNSKLTIDDEIISQDGKNLNQDDFLNFFVGADKVGFEEKYVTYEKYQKLLVKYRPKELIEADRMLENMREIKSEDEINKIEKACNITDNCFLHILDYIEVGMTEKQIALEIYNFFMKNGAEGLAFDTIVASGENSSIPHAIPTDRKIKIGDPVLIDFGAKFDGYCADMTRTFFIKEVSDEDRNLYELVQKVQGKAFEKMKNGANGSEIAKFVKNEFYLHDYDLLHALGHGVGMEVHEKPILSPNISTTLQENMIVTNEPGIYIPGKIGIRIEDTILINNVTATELTKSNKNLLVVWFKYKVLYFKIVGNNNNKVYESLKNSNTLWKGLTLWMKKSALI